MISHFIKDIQLYKLCNSYMESVDSSFAFNNSPLLLYWHSNIYIYTMYMYHELYMYK